MLQGGWITELFQLKKLVPLAADASFQEKWRACKLAGKKRLAEIIEQQFNKRGTPISIDPTSIFDCQVKRIHEYKRQLLNLLHAITLYHRMREGNEISTPRTVIFGGKSAPGYFMAKHIIRLINAVGEVVNNDPAVGGRLKVAFLADYRVSLAK